VVLGYLGILPNTKIPKHLTTSIAKAKLFGDQAEFGNHTNELAHIDQDRRPGV
jgi:hypothetical protein